MGEETPGSPHWSTFDTCKSSANPWKEAMLMCIRNVLLLCTAFTDPSNSWTIGFVDTALHVAFPLPGYYWCSVCDYGGLSLDPTPPYLAFEAGWLELHLMIGM